MGVDMMRLKFGRNLTFQTYFFRKCILDVTTDMDQTEIDRSDIPNTHFGLGRGYTYIFYHHGYRLSTTKNKFIKMKS